MGLPTYDLLGESVLGSATSSVTFSNLSQAYRDLVVEFTGNIDGSGYPRLLFNSNSSSIYSSTTLVGYGSGTWTANLQNNSGVIVGGYFGYWPNSATVVATNTVNIFSYANTTTFKPVFSRDSHSGSEVSMYSGVWRSTAAITSVTVSMGGTVNFRAGTSIRLWGIA